MFFRSGAERPVRLRFRRRERERKRKSAATRNYQKSLPRLHCFPAQNRFSFIPHYIIAPVPGARCLSTEIPPDGRPIERNSASIRFPLQGEAVALADRRVVTHGRGPFCAKSNDFSVIWTHLPLSFCCLPPFSCNRSSHPAPFGRRSSTFIFSAAVMRAKE
jgi:hypothetical protein